MGCSASKLEDEEAVQLCKDRRNFIKQAVEQRIRFATTHVAYIQSLKRVSQALRSYIDGDDHNSQLHHHHDFMSSDSYSTTSPFTPVKHRFSQDVFRIPFKSPPSPSPSPVKTIQQGKGSYHQSVHYLRSGGGNTTSVSVQQRPPQSPPTTMRVDSYYNTMENNSVGDGFFPMQSPSPMRNPSYFAPSPYRPTYPPPSPQTSQWDFFWNPFASLESYGYPSQNGIGHLTREDEMAGLRQVREEEGIPDLEEDVEEKELSESLQQGDTTGDDSDDDEEEKEVEMVVPPIPQMADERTNVRSNPTGQAETASGPCGVNKSTANHIQPQTRDFQSHGTKITQQNDDNTLELSAPVANSEVAEANTPGFTVYIDRRPTNMSEVMRDVESQFTRICDCANEVSIMLEASRAQFCSPSKELTAIKMLNPVALFRTASSRSTSSRFLLQGPSSCREDDYCETSSEFSEESCMLSGSHQTTLDKLYAWEKKLFEEVKNGERMRIAYEKRCLQLRNCDVAGEDPSSVDKAKRAMRDLYTQIQVSIHSIEAISRRIEKLRDEELHPQLMELLQGLVRMWKTMADSHLIQKRIIDEVKPLLASPKLRDHHPPPPASRLARSASNLESELRNWRACFEAWISSQRSYARALAGWLIRCAPPPSAPGQARSPLSPPRPSSVGSDGAPPIFDVCLQWSRAFDAVSDEQALEGLDFFAAGVASVVAQQREEEAAARRAAMAGEVDGEECVAAAAEKMAELAVRVVCAGLAVAVGSLAKFAVCSVEGCQDSARGTGEDEKARRPGV